MSKRLLLCIALLGLSFAHAVTLEEAAQTAERDLREALTRLAATHERIEAEKLPLAERLAELEAQVIEKRREAEKLQRTRDTGALALENLQTATEAQSAEIDFVESLLGEYLRNFETRLHVAEIPAYDPILQRVKTAAEAEQNPAARLQAQLSLLESAIARLRKHNGGLLLAGSAIAPDGALREGRFGLAGPLAWFAGEGVAGIVTESPALRPKVVPVAEEHAAAITQLAESAQATVPVDPTVGDAILIARTGDDLVTHLKKGRIWIVPILAFAVLAVLVSLFKFFDIFSIRQPSPTLLPELLEKIRRGDSEAAQAQVADMKGPFGRLLRDAVAHANEKKELLDEILYEHILATQPKVERYLPFLSVTAATAPLLGLLGTVTGMINTFMLINLFGTGNPRSLASGISEALVTTEAGLVVAIFALIAHAFLSRRAQGILASLEKTAVAFVNGLPGRRQE